MERFHDRGFALIPSLIDGEACAAYAAGLDAEWERVGRPGLYSKADVHVEEGMHISPVGLARAGILLSQPELAEVLLHPRLQDAFEALLGSDFELELGTGVVSDASRGFLEWHQHAGGIDEPDLRRRHYPCYERVERIGCTLYTSPLDEEHGMLLVKERAVDSPTEPPHAVEAAPWPTQTEVRAPRGSVVLLDQGTWHAVSPMRAAGRRHFFAFFVRRAGLPATKRKDGSIAAALTANAALAKAFGGAP